MEIKASSVESHNLNILAYAMEGTAVIETVEGKVFEDGEAVSPIGELLLSQSIRGGWYV